ncbi:MAG: hypothetical protein N3H84_04325 [Candidatus Caldarchaeum sp.]|nr:hypothetical protein [Candidatus Caldarchaeum sp.]MCX8201310.1 hypothetical protein [Candidatus Caldarchaeum sp.]MDW8434782.1 hypothetical protein [Candidatus Caldarchaeum sp.]
MRDWWIDGETGLPQEAAEKLRRKLASIVSRTDEGYVLAGAVAFTENSVKPLKPLSLGLSTNYFTDIVSANITIPSKTEEKTDISDAELEALADIRLPSPKKYRRLGREELGFIADEMPAQVKTSHGDIDVKALLAVLVAKVARLEEKVMKDELVAEKQ